MSYRIKRSEDVQNAIRRIATEQIERAVREIDDQSIDRHEVVHQIRKRCKKLRGLVRLVRPALKGTYAKENAAFRDAARPLSGVRDAKTTLGTFDQLLKHFDAQIDREQMASVGRELTKSLRQVEECELESLLADFHDEILQARSRVEKWELASSGFKSIQGGMRKTHERARDRLDVALDNPSTESLHELRKRLKYLWYHVRLIESLWKPNFTTYAEQVKEAAETLGDDHDLAVLRAKLLESPESFGAETDVDAVVALLDRRRTAIQRRGLRIARYVLAESTNAFLNRAEKYWSLWR